MGFLILLLIAAVAIRHYQTSRTVWSHVKAIGGGLVVAFVTRAAIALLLEVDESVMTYESVAAINAGVSVITWVAAGTATWLLVRRRRATEWTRPVGAEVPASWGQAQS